MGNKTNIEWTRSDDGALGATWNPVRGCSRVSEGCRNCYAETMAARFCGPGMPYEGLAADGKWTGKVRLVPEHLADPLRWKRPRRIFVNSMSDLFHEGLADEEIAAVFGVMVSAPQHTFQVLTKRPARMRDWMAKASVADCVDAAAKRVGELPGFSCGIWPGAANIWLGVSVENQTTADERIPLLLQTPSAVRFVSCEPLIGPVDLTTYLPGNCSSCGKPVPTTGPAAGECSRCEWGTDGPGLDWVIVGGESGPGARPCEVGWIRRIAEDCEAAGVACFVKQLGANAVARSTWDLGPDAYRSWDSAHANEPFPVGGAYLTTRDKKGGDPQEWPEDLRVREFPSPGGHR